LVVRLTHSGNLFNRPLVDQSLNHEENLAADKPEWQPFLSEGILLMNLLKGVP
jgi:hypothetical protein